MGLHVTVRSEDRRTVETWIVTRARGDGVMVTGPVQSLHITTLTT